MHKPFVTHVITKGNGPLDAGGWPLAHCTCGWSAVSKDEDIVDEAIQQHSAVTNPHLRVEDDTP